MTTYLTVHSKPLPDLGPEDLCSSSQLTISPGAFTSYRWQDNSTANSFIVNKAGVYWVKVANDFNCTATDTFTVNNILPIPTNFLKEQDSICTSGTLDIVSKNVYRDYQWSDGSAERKVTVQAPGIYWLKVTDIRQPCQNLTF